MLASHVIKILLILLVLLPFYDCWSWPSQHKEKELCLLTRRELSLPSSGSTIWPISFNLNGVSRKAKLALQNSVLLHLETKSFLSLIGPLQVETCCKFVRWKLRCQRLSFFARSHVIILGILWLVLLPATFDDCWGWHFDRAKRTKTVLAVRKKIVFSSIFRQNNWTYQFQGSDFNGVSHKAKLAL